MIENPLFLEATELDGALEIVNERICQSEDLHRRGQLPPALYDDVLLLAADILPHVENQAEWVGLGLEIRREIQQTVECCGCPLSASMLHGLGYRCFAVRGFCEQAHVMGGFSRELDHLLFLAAGRKAEQARRRPARCADYDLVCGLSGTLYYLLDCGCTREERAILVSCIEYLLSLVQDTVLGGMAIPRFHRLPPGQSPGAFQQDGIWFGLAHGMLGPLIALAKAHAKGFSVEGLEEGIEILYRLYETYQLADEHSVPCWPGAISPEEYREGACRPERPCVPSSWCCGNLGILRGLQKAAGYMNWPERERTYLEAMKGFLAQDCTAYHLAGPSLCHGYSGLAAIQIGVYAVYEDPGLLTNLERNVKKVMDEYREANRKDSSLLTGSLGVAAALLPLQGRGRTGKLLMID